MRNRNAFTVVEVLIVVLISTVVMAGIYATFLVGNQAWTYYNDSVAIKKEVRNALIAMVNELREAEDLKVVQSQNLCSVQFRKPDIGYVSYMWNRHGTKANQIIRRSGRGTRILAKYIERLALDEFGDSVQISVTAAKLASNGDMTQVDLKEKVALRPKTVLFQ